MRLLFPAVAQTEPKALVARRVTEMAQSTLDMVSTAVDFPLCECAKRINSTNFHKQY